MCEKESTLVVGRERIAVEYPVDFSLNVSQRSDLVCGVMDTETSNAASTTRGTVAVIEVTTHK